MEQGIFTEVSTQDLRDPPRVPSSRSTTPSRPLTAPPKITHARKAIARVKTELRQRELNNK